jgi:hypothetical protein
MLITSFDEEGILDQSNLVLKSLTVLAFICPNEDTNTKIRYHRYREELEKLRYNEVLSKYIFLSLVNPQGYTLVTKNLPRISDRQGIEIDFLFVEEASLYEYLQIVNVFSNTCSLN